MAPNIWSEQTLLVTMVKIDVTNSRGRFLPLPLLPMILRRIYLLVVLNIRNIFHVPEKQSGQNFPLTTQEVLFVCFIFSLDIFFIPWLKKVLICVYRCLRLEWRMESLLHLSGMFIISGPTGLFFLKFCRWIYYFSWNLLKQLACVERPTHMLI